LGQGQYRHARCSYHELRLPCGGPRVVSLCRRRGGSLKFWLHSEAIAPLSTCAATACELEPQLVGGNREGAVHFSPRHGGRTLRHLAHGGRLGKQSGTRGAVQRGTTKWKRTPATAWRHVHWKEPRRKRARPFRAPRSTSDQTKPATLPRATQHTPVSRHTCRHADTDVAQRASTYTLLQGISCEPNRCRGGRDMGAATRNSAGW